MPLPNEHAARQRDPSLYEKLRRGELPGAPSGISAIFGVLPDGKTEIQSIRAKDDELTADAFRSWLREHEFKAEIEEADVEAKEEEQEDLAVDVFVKKKEEEEEEEVREDLAGFWGSPCLLSSGPESWVEIVRSGTFYGATGPKPRKVELTEDDVLSMVVNHEQVTAERWFSDGAPVGYNHASSFGVMDPDSTRAAARIRKLQTRRNEHGGISLWGLFSWTPDGARRVKGGEFSSVSAELLPSGVATSKLTGKAMTGWTLVGATLTNSPFVPGMQAPSLSGTLAAAEEIHRVHLSELVKQEASRMTERTTAQQLTEILGTPEAQLLSRVQRLQEEADKVATLSEALKIATEETETLRAQNVLLEEREKERILDAACSAGRIAPTQREVYWNLIGVAGEEEANRLFTEGKLPVAQVTADTPAEDGDVDSAFLALVETKRAEGLSESEAWDIARTTLGPTLYGTTEN